MKHLKKIAVILMMLLLITTNFTASVYADDGQTADDTSTTAEFVEKEEGDNELPATEQEGETVLPAETTDPQEDEVVPEEPVAEEKEVETPATLLTNGYPVEVVFVEFGARDGIGQLPDSIHALAPKDLTWDGQNIPDIKLESESVDGFNFDGWNPWLIPGTDTLRMYGFWVNGNASKKLKAPMLHVSASVNRETLTSTIKLRIQVRNLEQLNSVIANLRKIESVYSVERETN